MLADVGRCTDILYTKNPGNIMPVAKIVKKNRDKNPQEYTYDLHILGHAGSCRVIYDHRRISLTPQDIAGLTPQDIVGLTSQGQRSIIESLCATLLARAC